MEELGAIGEIEFPPDTIERHPKRFSTIPESIDFIVSKRK